MLQKTEITKGAQSSCTWELDEEEIRKAIAHWINTVGGGIGGDFCDTVEVKYFKASGRMCEGETPSHPTKAVAKRVRGEA